MYVCLCNAVTESDIKAAAAEGASSVDDLAIELGLGTNCGTCQTLAQSVLDACTTPSDTVYQTVPASQSGVYRYTPNAHA
ncbi:MAG: (2Fe-2S)-binding protein [Pseudomonadota bacterium]